MRPKKNLKIRGFVMALLSLLIISSCTLETNQLDSTANSLDSPESTAQAETSSKGYGALVIEGHLEQRFCYNGSDLDTLIYYVRSRAISEWTEKAKSSWAKAIDKSIIYHNTYTSFYGPGIYVVYVEVSARPYYDAISILQQVIGHERLALYPL